MKRFIHNVDENRVIINDEEIDFDLFKKLEPDYDPPKDQRTRVYIQEREHYKSNGSTIIPLPMPWEDGDRFISRLNEFKNYKKIYDDEARIESERIRKVRSFLGKQK